MSAFPKNFLWGAATASYQVEGGIENCDWAQAAREGRVPVCGRACDHYNRFREDFDLAKSLGHNAHRFSVEWARIEPEEGKFDEAAIEHYREVLRALRERGLEPSVTLWHFTLPLWLSSRGGWEHRDTPRIFARYCAYVTERIADLTSHVSTINEPLVFTSIGYLRGDWPPFGHTALIRSWRVFRALAQGHNEAYSAIKQVAPTVTVSLVKHTVAYEGRGLPWNHLAAWVMNELWTHMFMRRVAQHCDFIGLNYYNRKVFGDTRVLEKTDMGWNIDPAGIETALTLLAGYGKPIVVTEAGCADATDRFRAAYIEGLIRAVANAMEKGVDVRGFFYWSLLDNYEWACGFEKRFGLIAIDYDTLERRVRPSAYVYRETIERMTSRDDASGTPG